MVQSTMYKLSFYRFKEVGIPSRDMSRPIFGLDRARNKVIPTNPSLSYFEEVFTTQHWLVRIFRWKIPNGKGTTRK